MTRFVIMLDSGAYSVWARSNPNPHRRKLQSQVQDAVATHGSKIAAARALDLSYGLVLSVTSDMVERLVTLENYAKFVNEYRYLFRGGVWNYDVIGSDKGSYENWLELRRLGVDTLPIFHIGEDEAYLRKYLDMCEFIGIGAIAKMDAASRIQGLDHIWKTYLTTDDGAARCRIHGLGLTDFSIVLRYPWYSVDSTTSIAAAAYGNILVPKLSESGASYDRLSPMSISDQSRKSGLPSKGQKIFGYSDTRIRAFGSRGSGRVDFYRLPQRAQDALSEFVGMEGLVINPTREGRVLRSKMLMRQARDPVWVNGLGIEDVVEEQITQSDDEHNLSLSWRARYTFNLLMIRRFVAHWREAGKTIRLYNVVGGGHVFDAFVDTADSSLINRALVSFTRLIAVRNDASAMVAKLEQSVGGHTEKRSVISDQTRTAGDGAEGVVRSGKQDRVSKRQRGGVQRRSSNTAPTSWRPRP